MAPKTYIHREIHRSAFSRWFSVDEEVYDVGIRLMQILLKVFYLLLFQRKEEVCQTAS